MGYNVKLFYVIYNINGFSVASLESIALVYLTHWQLAEVPIFAVGVLKFLFFVFVLLTKKLN